MPVHGNGAVEYPMHAQPRLSRSKRRADAIRQPRRWRFGTLSREMGMRTPYQEAVEAEGMQNGIFA
jgi:hypothetical protein